MHLLLGNPMPMLCRFLHAHVTVPRRDMEWSGGIGPRIWRSWACVDGCFPHFQVPAASRKMTQHGMSAT